MLGSVSGILLALFLAWLAFVMVREVWQTATEAWQKRRVRSKIGRDSEKGGAVTGWYYIAGGGRREQEEEEEEKKEEEEEEETEKEEEETEKEEETIMKPKKQKKKEEKEAEGRSIQNYLKLHQLM